MKDEPWKQKLQRIENRPGKETGLD